MALHRPEGQKGKPIVQWRRRRAHTAEAGTPERKAPREEPRRRQGRRGARDEPDQGREAQGAKGGAAAHTHRRSVGWAAETMPGREAGVSLRGRALRGVRLALGERAIVYSSGTSCMLGARLLAAGQAATERPRLRGR